MARFGLRVPPGFTLTTEACRLITASTATSTGTSIADMEAQLPQSLWEQLEEGLLWLESVSGAVLGGPGIDKRVDKTMRGVDGDMSSSGIGQPMQRNTAAAPAANLSGKAPTLLVSVRSGMLSSTRLWPQYLLTLCCRPVRPSPHNTWHTETSHPNTYPPQVPQSPCLE